MMLDAQMTLLVGQTDKLLTSFPVAQAPGVIFEDDGTTGYFYAVQSARNTKVLDALHIYDVARVSDGAVPSVCQVFWNDEQTAAALVINDYCHAVFDFQGQAGFCRTGFPAKRGAREENRLLSDELLARYFPSRQT